MFTFESDTREALLKSGRDEILEKGFEKASLRSVCAHAGLTTGAFYSNFMRKEDLLVAIVEDELAACDCSYDGIVDIIVADFKGNLDAEIKSAEFVVAHKELLKLLLDCSEGSCYEDFKERLCDKLAEAYGWKAERVDHPDHVEGAIARMLAEQGPYLLDVRIQRDQSVYPIVAPGHALTEVMGAIDSKSGIRDLEGLDQAVYEGGRL